MRIQGLQRWFFVIVFLAYWNGVWAGTTGKIVGQVVDAETGEPLPGANIQIEGTPMGAATDEDGQFLIINVPVGTYTVEVVAERPLVRRDQTASIAEFSGEDIRQLPVETFQEVLSLQAGVTVDPAGGIHIRGGRSSEITYIVDGIPITDEYSGLPSVSVENNVIEELRLVSGAFNAEYGKAMSGVVNIVTREGGNRWEVDGRGYVGDYVSSHRSIFMNIDNIKPSAIQNEFK